MSTLENGQPSTVPSGEMVLNALKEGAQRALRIHKALGNPIATFKNGKVVIVPAEEIKLDEPAPPLFTPPEARHQNGHQ